MTNNKTNILLFGGILFSILFLFSVSAVSYVDNSVYGNQISSINSSRGGGGGSTTNNYYQATPNGTNTQVQFNDNGVFGGSTQTYNKSNGQTVFDGKGFGNVNSGTATIDYGSGSYDDCGSNTWTIRVYAFNGTVWSKTPLVLSKATNEDCTDSLSIDYTWTPVVGAVKYTVFDLSDWCGYDLDYYQNVTGTSLTDSDCSEWTFGDQYIYDVVIANPSDFNGSIISYVPITDYSTLDVYGTSTFQGTHNQYGASYIYNTIYGMNGVTNYWTMNPSGNLRLIYGTLSVGNPTPNANVQLYIDGVGQGQNYAQAIFRYKDGYSSTIRWESDKAGGFTQTSALNVIPDSTYAGNYTTNWETLVWKTGGSYWANNLLLSTRDGSTTFNSVGSPLNVKANTTSFVNLSGVTNAQIFSNGNATFKNLTAVNVNVTGNFSAKMPYGTFSSSQTQTVAVASTAYNISFNWTDDSYLITKTNDVNFTVKQSGDYYIDVSAIFSTDLPNKHVELWARKNGVDIPRSNTKMELATAGIEIPLAVSFIIDLNTTDVVTLMYASDDAGSQLVATGATAYSPASPSIIMNMYKISEITE
jgi:hypothetical protein